MAKVGSSAGSGHAPDAPSTPSPETEAVWRGILLGTDTRYSDNHALMSRLPGSPRCRLCSAPFKGAGSMVARRMGRRPWPKNPHYCEACFVMLETQHGGAEIVCSLMFADVRGSTALAETMSATEFRRILNRFYEAAARVLFAHEAILDKFVGDEVMAIFVPALTGEMHGARAVAAAQSLLEATGHADPAGPWLPLGIGVHTGVAYVGAVGEAPSTVLTALGDTVNIAARLASAAGAGELLVSMDAARAAGLENDPAERRDLELKGKSERTPVLVLNSASTATGRA